jgi:hypothetical protein
LPSSHAVGQEAGGSQVSPASTAPLPQVAEQSESVVELQPAGQQSSWDSQLVLTLWTQATLQVAGLPLFRSVVQPLPSSQLSGHELAGSQVSFASRTPLPQVAAPVAPPVVAPPTPASDPPVLELPDGPLLPPPHDRIVIPKLSIRTDKDMFFTLSLLLVRKLNHGAPSHRPTFALVPNRSHPCVEAQVLHRRPGGRTTCDVATTALSSSRGVSSAFPSWILERLTSAYEGRKRSPWACKIPRTTVPTSGELGSGRGLPRFRLPTTR